MRKLGTYEIGIREVEVWVDSSTANGSFDHNESMVRIVIGLQHCDWWRCFEVATHEALELILSDLNCRYVPDISYGDSADEYIFHFNHPQFSEAVSRLGHFMAIVTPELATAYNDFTKRKKKRARKTKSV